MLRSLATVLAVCVVLWAAVTTSDEAVSVLAVAVGVLVLLRLGDQRRIERLEDRFDALVQRLREVRASAPMPSVHPSREGTEADDVPRPALPDVEAVPVVEPSSPTPRPAARTVDPSDDRPATRPAPRSLGQDRPVPRDRPALPGVSLDDLPPPLQRAWAFATGGNLVARISLLVLFVGLGLGIRYAVEEGFLSVEIRLAFAAVAGLVLIGVGWRLRDGTPGFGLTLQGGGVATLYLTIYAAYALYGLIPSLPAIVLMGAVAVACGGLAFLQNAPGLAVLGVTGGFAAPVLAGTAEGNHVLLLSYYALLNVGVLVSSWAKGWRSVAVVGFLSTFVTGTLWGGLSYRPEWYGSVQPFVVVSFAIYLALAVRFALRTATRETPERALAVDGALVFGLPAATFVLQAGLVEGVVPYGRAWSAAALAAVYLLGAGVLRQRSGVRLLADAFLAIGLAFATLALPLAFERVVFGAMWVLEGAGLVWVGARQRKGWMRLGGLVLQGAAAAVLFAEGVLRPSTTFSPESLTGWIVAVGLGLSAYVLRGLYASPDPARLGAEAEEGGERWAPAERAAGRGFLAFALFWWTTTAAVHVLDLAPERYEIAGLLGAAAASGALFLGLGRVLRWPALGVAAFGVVGAGWLLWMVSLIDDWEPVVAWRGVGWAALFAVAAVALRTYPHHRFRTSAFVGAVWLAVAVVAWGLADALSGLAGAWALGAAGAVIVAGLVLSIALPASWASARERGLSVGGLAVAVAVWMGLSWTHPGTATPLPTVPPLDPIGLPTIAGLLGLVAARRVSDARREALTVAVGALGFGALTAAVLRAAHAAGASAWDAEALFASSTVQAALAVVWTLLAVVLTVWAVRRESRGLWFFGVGVLGLVVVKLFLVDLSQAEALVRIGAFLVVGVLGLLIGYQAPLPPKREEAD
ncbi:hypothetical protein B1759_04580 [Rubrivirga sp. SAORIC476]|uniref:DUF2339 domain-containing protein n=1 Tax=Rubrivirga sp. SAORIC476 TaxID=1961794 RepID=UPI000BA947E5|nr:DUF2339 domain-containing protein [Rubrivirga sp. SAORIC476]PAP80659.1 hypothetical protein B1759_04580 [Rubrivirga sp. SAORIC476]